MKDEEVFNKLAYNKCGKMNHCDTNTESCIKQSMQEQSIAFAEWLDLNEWFTSSDDLWYKRSDGLGIGKTTAQLYEQFNKQ